MADTASIAQTAEDYLLPMIQQVQAGGSRITDFSTGSGARNLYEGLAAGLSHQSGVLEQLRQDSYLATATGDALDRKAADQQVLRKAAVPAAGTVRLTRQSSGVAVTIPAGWGTLLTVPVPNSLPVAFITTADALFGTTDTFIDVAAAAVEGGSAGNVAINTILLPSNPLAGFDSQAGFKAQIAFTGGVDEESDDALRARVPLEVAGRVKGRKEAFLAAALRVPGVTSATVLQAGDARADTTTVSTGNVEVYYEGSVSVLAQVTSESLAAATAGQNISVFTALGARAVANLTVTCLAGTDTVALAALVKATVQAAVNAFGVGQTAYASAVVQAIDTLTGVVAVNVPFTDLRLFTAPGGTFGDIVPGSTLFPSLASADTTVTVNVI